jgi:hypothetical protein
MDSNKITKILGYSGLIPFYAFSLLTINENFTFFIDIFFLYSVIILSFLSGSLWMKLIKNPNQKNSTLYKFISIGFPLFALTSELFGAYVLKIIIYIAIYILLYIFELKTSENNLKDYVKMRFILTINVVLTHLFLLYAIFTYGIF